MAEVWTKIEFIMPTEKDYKLMMCFAKSFDSEDCWPVEEYDEEQKRIEIEEVLATQDEVVELAEILNNQIEGFSDPNTREICMGLEYQLKGTTEFYNCGEQIDYIIERKNGKTTIRETDNYIYVCCCEDYDEFCDMTEGYCEGIEELLPEDEFDPDCEYAVTYDKVYVDENPEYGPSYPIEEYMRHGEIFSMLDEYLDE